MTKGVKVKRSNRLTAEGRGQKAEGQKPVEKSRGQAGENTAPRAPRPAPQKKKTAGSRRDEITAFINRSVKTKPKGENARPPHADEEHTPSTYRLFFALRVPTEIANRLAEVQRKLKGNWRAVNPGQMHITLTYLPAVPPEKIEDRKRLGTRLMQDLPPMRVKLRGTGYFPNEGSPRVWFVKVEAEGLTELAEQLRAGAQELGVQTEDLPFKAHITLARKKGPAPRVPPLILDHLEWTATGGTLYRSILRKTGPIYEPQSTFRFRGEPPLSPAATSPPMKGERNKNKEDETQPEMQDTKEQST